MQQLSTIPELETEAIEMFVRASGFANDIDEGIKVTRRTRSSLKRAVNSVIVDDLKIETLYKIVSIEGSLKEVSTVTKNKAKKKKTEQAQSSLGVHIIKAELNGVDGGLKSVQCKNCNIVKAKCTQIHSYLLWLQHKQQLILQEVENTEQPVSKKIKRERNDTAVLKPVNLSTLPPKVELPSLPKLKKEAVAICPLEMESAMKLSLCNLIREYQGNDAQEFLQYCNNRMVEENCGKAQLLTIEQADTNLWHELRKGRVTASRMYEASRCTILKGSLTDKIMGNSSGFSFAMRRGTDLEGHVFTILQKEYPSLLNTGLVLDSEFPWMGASPDGLADDFVLEIKCPYTPNTHACYIDVNKLSKKYYAQIQLQMHMTRKTKALLGVASLDFEITRNVTKVWIDYDKEYVDKLMEESFEFWQKGIFPALLRHRKSKK